MKQHQNCAQQNHRASLMQAAPAVMKRAEQSARAAAAGQNDLFGGSDQGLVEADDDVTAIRDWSERDRSQQQITAELNSRLVDIPGVRAGARGSNSLNLRGTGGGIDVALLGNDYEEIHEAAKLFAAAIEERMRGMTR